MPRLTRKFEFNCFYLTCSVFLRIIPYTQRSYIFFEIEECNSLINKTLPDIIYYIKDINFKEINDKRRTFITLSLSIRNSDI